MKAIILAGGFATRLYPITKNQPKPLLPVAGKTIIEYTLENLEMVRRINECIISTNSFFEFHFKEWFSKYQIRKNTTLLIEKPIREDDKLGSIASLHLLIEKLNIKSDIFVIGGDNLFDFPLRKMFLEYKEKKAPLVAVYDYKDKDKIKGRYGVVDVDNNGKIIDFEEKPLNPKTSLINTACFILPKKDLGLFKEYLDKGNNPDAQGNFIKWLIEKEDVYAYNFEGPWFDIGSFESYNDANKYFLEKRKKLVRNNIKKIVNLNEDT